MNIIHAACPIVGNNSSIIQYVELQNTVATRMISVYVIYIKHYLHLSLAERTGSKMSFGVMNVQKRGLTESPFT